jgi:hypothetical protein
VLGLVAREHYPLLQLNRWLAPLGMVSMPLLALVQVLVLMLPTWVRLRQGRQGAVLQVLRLGI